MADPHVAAAPLRVVQWTTGNVGTQSVRAIVQNPGLELVGCYASVSYTHLTLPTICSV